MWLPNRKAATRPHRRAVSPKSKTIDHAVHINSTNIQQNPDSHVKCTTSQIPPYITLLSIAVMRRQHLLSQVVSQRRGFQLAARSLLDPYNSPSASNRRGPSTCRRYVQRFHFSFSTIPTVLLPPLVFSGLLATLWIWKCFMLVVFQNKIIYMPGLPPYARKEKISDYINQCHGVKWREEQVRAADGVQIKLCIADTGETKDLSSTVYILYFQGNNI